MAVEATFFETVLLFLQTSSCTSTSSSPTCRICLQPEEPGSYPYRLVSPCLCEGSIKYMHQFCVNRWIAESGTPKCELCGYQFHFRTRSMRTIHHVSSLYHAVRGVPREGGGGGSPGIAPSPRPEKSHQRFFHRAKFSII